MFCSQDSMEINEDRANVIQPRKRETRNHIIGNLIDRELNGTALHNLRWYSSQNQNISTINGPFGKSPPERLRMSIDSIIPRYALEAGNVFMGFSECGRYLLSYTCRPCELGLWNRTGDLSFIYKLHFWLFTPYKLATEVYSVLLFENQTILHDNLLIEIAQWPNDMCRLLVTGRSLNPTNSCTNDSLTYVTITTIPDAKPCLDCKYEAPDEGDEEYTEVTEARRLRKTCLAHGLTIHLTLDKVEPYPLFKPQIQLKYKDSVIFNTGNVFHMFTVLAVGPNEESPFKHELLNPPRLSAKYQIKKRHLQCDFWLKNDPTKPTSISLATIMKNCSSVNTCKKEMNRFIKSTQFSTIEIDENICSINKQILLLSSLTTNNLQCLSFPRRRLSASSCDSELSIQSGGDALNLSEHSQKCFMTSSSTSTSASLSWSWSKQPELKSACSISTEFKSPATLSSSKITSRPAKMLPQQARKFFKELRRVWVKAPSVPPFDASNVSSTDSSLQALSSEVPVFDVFEVNTDEIPIDRNFTSFRKRKLADKRYEFSDEVDDNNMIPRRRSTRKRIVNSGIDVNVDENSILNCGSGESSPRCEPNNTIQLGNASPRLVPSPALSPSYSNNPAEILRPITNNGSVVQAFSSSVLQEISKLKEDEDVLDKVKIKEISPSYASNKRSTRSSSKEPMEDSNTGPTFSSHLNCIAKVLRCYAETDESEDNLSVRTDTDDEYNQTLPFPIALVLNVHGKENQQLAMLSNSKARFCPTARIEILQRSLDIEILCNEVSTIICLANGKYFCCCFDYDVAIVDICPEVGTVTALAVVLFAATSLKRFQQERYSTYNYDLPSIPGIPDPRKKYEAIFSFTWNPSDERARILYMGNLVEQQVIPEQWHPTKYIVPHITSLFNPYLTTQMSLRNDLAVTDSQSLYQLKDFDGIITLYRHETMYERLKRQRTEAKYRGRVIMEAGAGTGASTSESEQDDDEFVNLSVNSDSSSMDSNEPSLHWSSG